MPVFDTDVGFRDTRRRFVARVLTVDGFKEAKRPFTIGEVPSSRAKFPFFVRLGNGFARTDSISQRVPSSTAEMAYRNGVDWETQVLVRFGTAPTPHKGIQGEENAMEAGHSVMRKLMAHNEFWPISYRISDPAMQVFPDTSGGHIITDVNVTCRWRLNMLETA